MMLDKAGRRETQKYLLVINAGLAVRLLDWMYAERPNAEYRDIAKQLAKQGIEHKTFGIDDVL